MQYNSGNIGGSQMSSSVAKGKALKVIIAGIDINNDTKTDFNQKIKTLMNTRIAYSQIH